MLDRLDSAHGGIAPVHGRMTRRDVLTRLATASALGVAGNVGHTAASTDPILAAIERHKAAWMATGALGPATDEVAAARRGREVAQADWDAFERASAIEKQAVDELLATPPESLEGMRAAITYILDFDNGYLPDLARPFLTALLKSPILAA